MKSIGKPIKLAVFGTRTYTNKKRVYFELDEICKVKKVIAIVSGIDLHDEKTKGVDSFARDYAKEKRILYIGYAAEWKDMKPPCLRRMGLYGEYNALAGINRNTKIVDECDEGLAFWDHVSHGTYDTITKMDLFHKYVKIIKI